VLHCWTWPWSVSQYQNNIKKTIVDIIAAREDVDSGSDYHNSLRFVNHQSNYDHQHRNIQIFYRLDVLLVARTTVSKH